MQKFLNLLNNSLFWMIVFLFAFIPLFPKFPLLNITGTFVAIRLEDFFIAFAFLIWFVYIFFSKKYKELLRDNIIKAILLFFFIGILSTFSAIFITNSVVPNVAIMHFLRRVEYMLLFPLVFTSIQTKKQLMIILMTMLVVVFLVNIYALGQQHLDWPVISTTNSEFSKGQILRLTPGARVNSTFAGHYDLAIFLAMVIVIFSSLFFAIKKRFQVLLVFTGIFSIYVLIMTAARLSFVAAVIGIISALFLSGKKKFILLFLGLVLIILVYPSQLRDRFISTITVNILHMGDRYEGKTQDQKIRSKLNIPTLAVKTSSTSASSSTFATQSGLATDITPGEPLDTTQLAVFRSFQIRLNIEWPRAINAFIKNPMLGTGYSSIDIATDNDFLRSLGEVGILGTISLVLVIIAISKRIFLQLKNNKDKFIRFLSAGILSALFAFVINGLFIDVFESSKVASLFWMIVGLCLSINNYKDD